jgi:hypothetical protein
MAKLMLAQAARDGDGEIRPAGGGREGRAPHLGDQHHDRQDDRQDDHVGEVSLKNVTGPITIADVRRTDRARGALPFLEFIAFISMSLGVMNLLPIPVLDGGHLLYYSLEVLTGRPLSARSTRSRSAPGSACCSC